MGIKIDKTAAQIKFTSYPSKNNKGLLQRLLVKLKFLGNNKSMEPRLNSGMVNANIYTISKKIQFFSSTNFEC